MLRRFTKGQIVGFITLCFIGLLVVLILSKVFQKSNEPQEEIQNIGVTHEGFTLDIKGNFVTYVQLGSKYKDKGAKAYDGKDMSKKIITTYFKDNTQVSKIDTKKIDTYLVKYEVASGNKIKEATRVVIVNDTQKPTLIMPSSVTIDVSEVSNYNVKKDIRVRDNSGKVSLNCKNTLKEKKGSYYIYCTAKDESGNKITKKRLIKVS